MFAVVFIVRPKIGRSDAYLALAKLLKPELERIDGFIDNERFRSRRDEGSILSLSTWRDEKSVIRWRTLFVHHKAQEQGRFEIFERYHLRVGEVTDDTDVPDGQTLRAQRLDETETGEARVVTITEAPVGADPGSPARGAIAAEMFDSITQPGKTLLLASWPDVASSDLRAPDATAGAVRHRRVRVIRDYGMTDRREAPQYYGPVPAPP